MDTGNHAFRIPGRAIAPGQQVQQAPSADRLHPLKAVEEKRFLPMGDDLEVQSDFQLIAGTNRDLLHEVAAGRFREDLFARINLWTYSLPSLAERPEDIEPNLDYLLELASVEIGYAARFNKESRAAFVRFATSADARWKGNFRDLHASVTRMATLAEAGRITTPVANAEIGRLRHLWRGPTCWTGPGSISMPCSARSNRQNWICSTRYNCKPCCRHATGATAFPMQAASCLRYPVRKRQSPTMRTDSRNTWPAMAWHGMTSGGNSVHHAAPR
jgi:DNA-binding NtrC family response regulator